MQIGQIAPEFCISAMFPEDQAASEIRKISLADYRGKWLVFFWYPLDFTFVCPTEILALSDRLEEFQEIDAEILGASCDSVYCHRAWMRIPRDQQGISGIRFPILADLTHQVARDYGVLIESEGIALRGLFIINPDGVLQHATINSLNVGRSVDETLRTLNALQSGGLCGSDWKPGDATIKPGSESK
jgi:peroxiredoxin 2/4